MRHYLTFMGGSDVHQVAYSVTLLRESAHEWYIRYERRHRNPPSDWAQLSNLLLERFGSNIRSQEAQEPANVHHTGVAACSGLCVPIQNVAGASG